MVNYFSCQEASSILGIKPGRLRYWNRIGLVKPGIRQTRKTYYDFHDLICLRTAQGLTAKGLPATKIKKSIDSLKKNFPGTDDHLANKRIYIFGNKAAISHKSHLIDALSGQLLFQFDIDELAEQVESRVKEFSSGKTAEDWFEEGLRYDRRRQTYERALHAYRQALVLDPGFADAWVNMGNIHFARKELVEAQRCYRLAIDLNSQHAKAHFNLGNVMDELNSNLEAVRCYHKSMQADPEFPDVYYNLAITSEKLEEWENAIQYWRTYLNFDTDTSHARFARRRIRLLRSNLAPS